MGRVRVQLCEVNIREMPCVSDPMSIGPILSGFPIRLVFPGHLFGCVAAGIVAAVTIFQQVSSHARD